MGKKPDSIIFSVYMDRPLYVRLNQRVNSNRSKNILDKGKRPGTLSQAVCAAVKRDLSVRQH